MLKGTLSEQCKSQKKEEGDKIQNRKKIYQKKKTQKANIANNLIHTKIICAIQSMISADDCKV